LDPKILVCFSLFSPTSVPNPRSSPLLLRRTTPTSPCYDGKREGHGQVRRPSLVVSAPRWRPSMKGKHVAADASVAYVEGEHGTSAANTVGYTPATVCLQLPTSPVVDPPGAPPGCLVSNAHGLPGSLNVSHRLMDLGLGLKRRKGMGASNLQCSTRTR
jgi:hypothetical protein